MALFSWKDRSPMRLMWSNAIVILWIAACAVRAQTPVLGAPAAGGDGLLSVTKIWDASGHNGFTDLARFQNRWLVAFREGADHRGLLGDGTVRVLASADGGAWETVGVLRDPRGDLRDAKICVFPDGRVELLTITHLHPADRKTLDYQPVAFLSRDLKTWDGPLDVGAPDVWMWGLARAGDDALSIGYGTARVGRFVRLFKTEDGTKFEPIVAKLPIDAAYPNESAISVAPDGTATAIVRCDPDPAYVGLAKPPYTAWDFKKTSTRVGGPALLRLPDGRLLGAGRLYDGTVRTSLFWVDAAAGTIQEIIKLPSGGDCSYPGLGLGADGLLRVSYYSSHEGKASVYFATVRLPEAGK